MLAKDIVEVVCYGKVETWEHREDAIEFYEECMRHSEGSEHSRYFKIWCDLMDGMDFCTDEE